MENSKIFYILRINKAQATMEKILQKRIGRSLFVIPSNVICKHFLNYLIEKS